MPFSSSSSRRSEHFTFQVADKRFSIQFLPVVFMEGYDEGQGYRFSPPVPAVTAATGVTGSLSADSFT